MSAVDIHHPGVAAALAVGAVFVLTKAVKAVRCVCVSFVFGVVLHVHTVRLSVCLCCVSSSAPLPLCVPQVRRHPLSAAGSREEAGGRRSEATQRCGDVHEQ